MESKKLIPSALSTAKLEYFTYTLKSLKLKTWVLTNITKNPKIKTQQKNSYQNIFLVHFSHDSEVIHSRSHTKRGIIYNKNNLKKEVRTPSVTWATGVQFPAGENFLFVKCQILFLHPHTLFFDGAKRLTLHGGGVPYE